MSTPILTTKLYIPPLRPNAVLRPRLSEQLNAGLHRKLTLISAAAGFGKTTLLSEWLNQLKDEGSKQKDEESTFHPSSLRQAQGKLLIPHPSQVAWLSLDEEHNDPIRFLVYFVAALRTLFPELGKGLLTALQSPQPPPPESVLTTLLNEITAASTSSARDASTGSAQDASTGSAQDASTSSARDASTSSARDASTSSARDASTSSESDAYPNFILILDDYHLIESPAVDQALTFLLQNLPPPMHIVIATREDPPLPLARLRARGQLTELRAHDLRFTESETAVFLNQAMGLNLTAADVAALENRTEGWIAGLQLAALSMQGHQDTSSFIQSFTGSHRFVLDYLVEEVLQQQPEDVQTFLLQTAVLDRLCASLCDAVMEGSEIGGLRPRDWRLKDGEQTTDNLQSPISNASTKLSTGLQSEDILTYLERANLFLIPLDDERRWYRYHHLFADLLRQRLQQKGAELVQELHIRASQWYEDNDLEVEAFQHAAAADDIPRAERLIEGRGTPLQFRGTAVPILNWLNSLPAKTLNASPSLLVTYASTLLALGQIARIEEKVQAAERLLQDAELTVENRDLIGRIASIRATVGVAQHQVETIITQANRALEYLSPDNKSVRTSIIWSLGYAYHLQGDRAAAGQAYTEAQAASQALGHMIIGMMSTIGLAIIQEVDNQLHLAAQTNQNLLQWMGDAPPLPICETYLGLARIHYEWNDLEAAQAYWEKNVPLAQQFGPRIDRIVRSDIFQARLKVAQGEINEAAAILAQAATAVQQQNFLLQLPDVIAMQVQVYLRQGNVDAAAQLTEKVGFPISRARVLLAQGKTEDALTLLAAVREQMEARQWADELLKVTVLQALAYAAHGDWDTAVHHLKSALTMTEPEGFIRTYIDEGEPMRELLARMKEEGRGIKTYIQTLLAAFGELDEIHPSSFIFHPLEEPLSEREMEVLQLVAQGLSNREISDQLFLALDTVKGHNRRIFGKLQAQNRTEAALRARELGLL